MYRVGIIGCGRVASLLESDPLRPHPCTHAGGYAAVSKTRLVAGCDINPQRLRDFKERWGVSRLYTDYREMLKRERLDLVSVCTWTDTHCEIVCAAARAGVRGIVCEKPMALDLGQCDRMIETCDKRGVKLVINHERRWESHYIKAREMVRAGYIGELRTIVGNVLLGKPRRGSWDSHYRLVGGGPLVADGTHLLDIMRFFAGDVEWVSGWVRREDREVDVEDTACGILYFKSGAIGFVEGGGLRKYFNFEVDLQGSEGRILIGNAVLQFWQVGDSPRYVGFRELAVAPFPHLGEPQNSYVAEIEELINCVEGGCESSSDGREGRASLELAMAIYESAAHRGKRIHLPLRAKRSPLLRAIREGKI
ncbi:MAG: Gfo/Idh/MocA family protein [bacterium]